MKKMAVILAMVILVLGFTATGVLSAQNEQQWSEEEIQKFNQKMAIFQLLGTIATEKDVAEQFIKKLENFQTDDMALSEKIKKNWFLVLKEYLKAIVCTKVVLEKFSERKDFISNQEISDALGGCYPKQLEVDIDRVLEDMDNAGLLEVLRKSER